MHLKPLKLRALYFLLLLPLSNVVHGQVVAAAHERSAPVEVGGGVSVWDADWGPGHMIGLTGFADIRPPVSGKLNGLGAELEFRDVDWHRQDEPPNYKQMSFGGGPIYTYPFRPNLRFYGKFLIEHGSMDFTLPNIPNYTHDSRLVYAPGGGAEYRIHNGLWARVDYEYQIWQPMFSTTDRPTPNGFTFEIGYDLQRFHKQ